MIMNFVNITGYQNKFPEFLKCSQIYKTIMNLKIYLSIVVGARNVHVRIGPTATCKKLKKRYCKISAVT